MMIDVTKYRYETFDFGDAVNMSKGTSEALATAKKEAAQAKELAERIAAEAPPAPTFSEAELEAAKAKAMAEGEAKGRAAAEEVHKAAAEAERLRAEELLTKINAGIASAIAKGQQERLKLSESLKAIAFAAAKKVVSGLPDASIKQIENFIDGALGVVDSDEGVKLLLHPETAKAFIEQMAERFEHMDIEEDDSILPNDMKILWKNGYSERKLDELWKEIGQIVVGDFDAQQFAPAEPVAVEAAEEPAETEAEPVAEDNNNKQQTELNKE